MKRICFFSVIGVLMFCNFSSYSQEDIQWWNPEDVDFPVMAGQGWYDNLDNFYDRLPAKAEKTVRKKVWELAHDGAGLKLRFRTQAKDIYVRYVVKNDLNKSHMPSTGVSGVDLYAQDKNGAWDWTAGDYQFGDTIRYHFSSLLEDYTREYHLYLPLYNQVEWMEIGTPDSTDFTPLPERSNKPIVVYGTSIAQGGVASRPGKAWTSILQRKLHDPLINLGFSGNGRLEKPVVDLLTELAPKLFVVDCLPNMWRFSNDTIAKRLKYTVKTLRQARPDTPVLIVEDADATIHSLDSHRNEMFSRLNKIADSVFTQLKSEGMNHVYLLGADEIGLDIESTVDGIHPNDYGMQLYADAYEKKIREILHEPQGKYSTTRPVKQYRSGVYDWNARHKAELELNKEKPPKIVFLGNSITHYWGGEPKEPEVRRGEESWNNYFKPFDVRNLGFSWDRIENVLWRVYHGELDGYEAKQVLINIGTNNLAKDSDKEIVSGLERLVQAVKLRQPDAEILMIGIYPRKGKEERVKKLNRKIVRLSGRENLRYIDPGRKLLDDSGKVIESYFQDKKLHPNAEGYEILGKAIAPYLVE